MFGFNAYFNTSCHDMLVPEKRDSWRAGGSSAVDGAPVEGGTPVCRFFPLPRVTGLLGSEALEGNRPPDSSLMKTQWFKGISAL
jgi:hypothetical protein